ncbi:hypothetical protein IHE61_25895 [Streptomyces sp. GKU 257-1]|nr:hypothetical protein [Streptomyces sp. GKU 257-1]
MPEGGAHQQAGAQHIAQPLGVLASSAPGVVQRHPRRDPEDPRDAERRDRPCHPLENRQQSVGTGRRRAAADVRRSGGHRPGGERGEFL